MKNPFCRTSVFTLLILLTSLVSFQFAFAGQIQLVWDPNSEPDLGGYVVYWGTTPGTYDNSKDVKNVTSYALTGLTKGQTYFITIKAYDIYNNESDPSNEVSGPAIDSPGIATLVSPSPSETITDTTPTYTWNAVPESSWYYLWVNDSTGTKIQKWYSAVEAGCPNGTGTCLVTPTTEVIGSCQWWIQAYNSAGYSPSRDPGLSFTVSPPVRAALVSPSSSTPINDNLPTYTWNPITNSTWYYLWVNDSTGSKIRKWYSALEAACPDGAGTCSVTPTTEVVGSCKWWIQTYNLAGLGPWSDPLTFMTPDPTRPGKAILVSPSVTILNDAPTYKWNPVANSTWYYLWVNDSTGTKIQKWYSASEAGCPSGTGTCSVTPTTEVIGPCQWWIQTYNWAGYGDWSSPLSFTAPTTLPTIATLNSPSGSTTTTPTYTWNAVPNSTWYYLWVNDSTGTKIQKWYSASEAGCPSGTGTCSVTPATEVIGPCQWWIQTYNSLGVGRWSDPLSFTAPKPTGPPVAHLVWPSGPIKDTTPTYIWDAVPGSSWYYLWVNDSIGTKIQKWYSAAEASCGIGTCSVKLTPALATGVGHWWIQTWNSGGFGPWSSAKTFTVGP